MPWSGETAKSGNAGFQFLRRPARASEDGCGGCALMPCRWHEAMRATTFRFRGRSYAPIASLLLRVQRHFFFGAGAFTTGQANSVPDSLCWLFRSSVTIHFTPLESVISLFALTGKPPIWPPFKMMQSLPAIVL